MKKLFLVLTLSLMASSVGAFVNNSLSWQKIALEEKVQRKLNSALATVLKDNQYIVEVEAEVSDPGSPNFGANDKPIGTRVSDLSLSESRGDYIAFSKIGLEVPVVDKFLDENRTNLMNLYRFNETYDLFKNLSAVNVTVLLSDKLPAELQDLAKKVVNSTRISFAGMKPAIKLENITLEWVDPAIAKKAEEERKKAEKEAEEARKRAEAERLKQLNKKPEEPMIWTKDWLEWASRWGNAFGLILGALIMGFMALTLFKQWKAFMEQFAANQLAQQKKPEDEKEKEEAAAAAAIMSNPEMSKEEEVESIHGIERFQQCLEQHPDDAITLVRSWLNDGEGMSVMALRAVAQQLSSGDMEKIFNGLSESQREKWKSSLQHHLDNGELMTANKHIFQEVVRSMLVPSAIKDGELLNLIMELDHRAATGFLKAHPNQVGLMLNILGPAMVSRILAGVEANMAESWLNQGFSYDSPKMDQTLPELKQTLMTYKKSSAPSPFTSRLTSMIAAATPATEGTLYRALAKAVEDAVVVSVAKKHFPAELMMDLPASILKEVIQSYPMAKRIELVASRKDDDRAQILNALAEEGTPARDLLDMELENLERDAARSAGISSRSDEIWFDFVKLARISLTQNASYHGIVDQLVHDWSKKLNVNLKGIKGGKAA